MDNVKRMIFCLYICHFLSPKDNYLSTMLILIYLEHASEKRVNAERQNDVFCYQNMSYCKLIFVFKSLDEERQYRLL